VKNFRQQEIKKALLIEVKYREAIKIIEKLEEKARKIQYPYKTYGIVALEIKDKNKIKNYYTIET